MRHDEVRRLHSQVVQAVVSHLNSPFAQARAMRLLSVMLDLLMALGRGAARTPVKSWLKHLFSTNFKLPGRGMLA